MEVRIRLEDHGVAPLIRRLGTDFPKVVSNTMNRVVLDIREAEKKMVSQSFDFWSAVTRTFLASERSFPFQRATPAKLEAKVFGGGLGSRSGTAEIFAKQEEGFVLKPGTGQQLELGKSPPAYAAPTEDKSAYLRTPRGRVPASRTPAGLLRNTPKQGGGFARFRRRRRRVRGVGNLGTRVFISPNDKAIIEITPGGGRRFLYALYQRQIPVPQHLHFFDTAERTVNAKLMPKLRTESDKNFGRF